MSDDRYLTFALGKGRLAKKTLALLEQIGITCDEMKDPDKQIRLELWAYSPKQFSEDNSADDISIVLSFGDTNDERIEEAVL